MFINRLKLIKNIGRIYKCYMGNKQDGAVVFLMEKRSTIKSEEA